MLKRLGLAGFLGAVVLAVASSPLLSVRLLVFVSILTIFGLAVKLDERRKCQTSNTGKD